MRRMLVNTLIAFLAILAVSEPAAAQKKGDRSLITRSDLNEAGTSVSTALDAVQRLRPNWLRPPAGRMATAGVTDGFGARGANATEPIVYIDEVRQPSLDILRTVQSDKVTEIKYMDQNRAVQMLGPGHEAGAILVATTAKR